MIRVLFPIILLGLILFTGCNKEKLKPAIKNLNLKELPAQESWSSNIFFSDSGKTKAILSAGHLRMYSEARETLLDSGLVVDFYNPEQIKTTTLTSKRGRVDDITLNLYAYENVKVVNDSGVTVKTDELMWRNKDKKIISDKFVTIETPFEIIQGYGFESDQRLKNYVIYKITYITSRAF